VREIDTTNGHLMQELALLRAQVASLEQVEARRARAERRLAAQYAVSCVLAESATLDEAAPGILQAIGEGLEWELGVLWYVDHDVDILRCSQTWHAPTVPIGQFETVSRQMTFRHGVGLPGRVLANGEPAWIADVLRDTNFPRLKTAAEVGFHAAFAFPIKSGGEVLGVAEFLNHRIQPPDSELLQMVSTLGNQIGQFIERKRMEAERTRLLEAEQAARVREEFLALASHELKTPLTTVKVYGQLLARHLRQPSPDYQRLDRFAHQIQDQIGRLETLVTDLLDASRIQRGRLELHLEDVDLAQLTEQVLSRFELAPERTEDHTVVLDTPEPVEGIWDRARLDQVLTNLISNALKYSPHGGEVRVTVRQSDDHAELIVSDQGIGIAASDRPRLFQPFIRGKSAHLSANGTGLGLYIAAQIVEQHGGTIDLESEPAEGSTFTVRLPLVPPVHPENDGSGVSAIG
jgi:signal transduction histidine kinase